MVCTSPPYWGLRDYGTATWAGGDESCPHRIPATGSTQNKGNNNREGKPFDAVCGVCGAIRQDAQLGLEPTPEEYVANLVDVFREVRRVLRSDGTVWLNLGDSYNAYNGGAGPSSSISAGASTEQRPRLDSGYGLRTKGLKPKDLVGIPWRVAFALQADGWYLRSDIIWAKPNPMPESVTDRPTKSHEYLFLLSKSARYYYDADAVREPHVREWDESNGGSWSHGVGDAQRVRERGKAGTHSGEYPMPNPAGRNLRSVWTIATQPYPGAHFATFPRKLVEPCVKAGTSERGVCPECGAPWVRVVERERAREGATPHTRDTDIAGNSAMASLPARLRTDASKSGMGTPSIQTTGWRPACAPTHVLPGHTEWTYPDPIPATVLDPFAGSGTTGLVAQSLSRRAVLIDLNADYLVQAMGRNRDIPLGLVG